MSLRQTQSTRSASLHGNKSSLAPSLSSEEEREIERACVCGWEREGERREAESGVEMRCQISSSHSEQSEILTAKDFIFRSNESVPACEWDDLVNCTKIFLNKICSEKCQPEDFDFDLILATQCIQFVSQ
jgi:hypothetical protein